MAVLPAPMDASTASAGNVSAAWTTSAGAGSMTKSSPIRPITAASWSGTIQPWRRRDDHTRRPNPAQSFSARPAQFGACWLRCGPMPARSWIAAEGMLVPENICGNACAVSAAAAGGDVHTTLVRMHSVFERLIYIGTLVNHRAGRDPGEEPAERKARRLLRKEHQAVFERWLCLSLRDKMADLEACAEDHGGTVLEVVRYWILPRCHPGPIPAAARLPIMAAAALPGSWQDNCEVLKTE
jgi:hypothetical protein